MSYKSKVMLYGRSCNSMVGLLSICKIIEPSKQHLRVEILHDLKDF